MTRPQPPRRRHNKREARTNPISWLDIFRAVLALAALLYQWLHDHT